MTTSTGVTLPAVTVQILDAYANVVTSDNSDAVTLSVASGPGSFLAGSTTTAVAHNGVATFTNLTLVTPGTYTLGALVPHALVGPDSNAFGVTPLQVLSGSLAGSPSGFSLSFNTPFLVNSLTPALYGTGFGSTKTVTPTVTLTGPGGPVEGSVVLNPASNTLTFIETDTANVFGNGLAPQLPDGTYTVDITSNGANGLQALNPGGGFLDGLGTSTPGSGDYIGHFTVSTGGSSAEALWIPATADGPKQTLQAPGNNLGGLGFTGYPVYLNDSTGKVTSVTVTFNYNPTMLTVTGASNNSNLPGSSFTLDTVHSTPGHAVLVYADSGANAAALKGGSVPLGFINATVPNSSAATPIYKGKDLLTLTNIAVNGGGITPVIGVGALHVVVFVGDADGNGSYSSNDAVLITRTALQSDSGFAAYPLVDPVIVADTDGSGFLPADAALQVNEVGVGFPASTVPPTPAGANTMPIGNNVDPTLTLEMRSQGPGVSGGIVTATVNIDDADPVGSTGLLRGHLALTYDPTQFTVSTADVHAGALLAGGNGWRVVPTINPVTGEIAIALSSDTPISSPSGGTLVTIDFHPVERMDNPSGIALAGSVDPTGNQVVATELEDTQGTFTLSFTPGSGVGGVKLSANTPVEVLSNNGVMGSAGEQRAGDAPVTEALVSVTAPDWASENPPAPSGGRQLPELTHSPESDLRPEGPNAPRSETVAVALLSMPLFVSGAGPVSSLWHAADSLLLPLVQAAITVMPSQQPIAQWLDRASQLLLSEADTDGRWEDVVPVDNPRSLLAPGSSAVRDASASAGATATLSLADQAALDQYFALAADDGDLETVAP
jgi:hypothetical protein